MSDRDRFSSRSSSTDQDRDRDQRPRDRERNRDEFGRDESRRSKYGSGSTYPDTDGSSSNYRDRYYEHDQRRRRSPTPSPSPSPPPRVDFGRNRGRGRGGFRRRDSGSGSSSRFQHSFSEEDWTQRPSQPNSGRRESKAELSSRGANSEALDLFEKLRTYAPYLRKRRMQIIREGKERQFGDQLEDIRFWLDSARDINSDQTLGVCGMKNILTGIMEMARQYPVKEPEPLKPQQEVFDVSSGGEEEDRQRQEEYAHEPHSFASINAKTEEQRPTHSQRLPSPSPQRQGRRPRQRKRPGAAFPKADITTNWDYDPTKPDPEDEDSETGDEEFEEEAPWSREDQEVDREHYGGRSQGAGTSSQRQRSSERERGPERWDRNPSPPPRSRPDPVTPNQRQRQRQGSSGPPPVYDPFDQLSDDEEPQDDDRNRVDNDNDEFGARTGQSSPTFSNSNDDNFESLYQRPVRRPPPVVPEPEPELQLQQQRSDSRSSTSTESQFQFTPPTGYEFPPREHGFAGLRRVYNPENNRRIPVGGEHPLAPGLGGAPMTARDMPPPPEIPLEPGATAGVYDPRPRPAPLPQHRMNGHDPRLNTTGAPLPDPRTLPPLTDPRLAAAARIGQSRGQAPMTMQHQLPNPNLPPPSDPRLGSQRGPTYANPVAGAAAAGVPSAVPAVNPMAAMVATCLTSGIGLTPEQQQMIAMNLTAMSGAATGVQQAPMAPFAPPPQQQQQQFQSQGQFMPPQQPIMRPPTTYPGAPPQPHAQIPANTAAAAPKVNQELLMAQIRAKAALCFSSPRQWPGPGSNTPRRPIHNFSNPQRFQGPSRHGPPNRFPFKQRLPAVEEARRREKEALERERERERQEEALRTKSKTSWATTDGPPASTSTTTSAASKETPMIATNQIPATMRPGMKPRKPPTALQRQHSSSSESNASRSSASGSSKEHRRLEETRQRVREKLTDLPQAQKKKKLDEIRENALKTLPIIPLSVAARKMSTSKAQTSDQDTVPRSPPSTAGAKKKKNKVEKTGAKRRRVISSSSESDINGTNPKAPEADDDASRGSADMDLDHGGDSPPATANPPAENEEFEPPPPGTTPPPTPVPTTPATTMAPLTSASTSRSSDSPGKKSRNRELDDLHGYLREMNFDAQMPTGPRRRGGTAASEVSMASSSSASVSSSVSNLTSTIESVAKGPGTAGAAKAKPKPKPKPKTPPKGKAKTPTGRGRGRPPKNPAAGGKKKPVVKKPVGRPRIRQEVIDALAASEAASATAAAQQDPDLTFDMGVGSEPSFGGVVIGRNDIIVNPTLGKIKMEADYVPPAKVKTEPDDMARAPAQSTTPQISATLANYPRYRFGGADSEGEQEVEDEEEYEEYVEEETTRRHEVTLPPVTPIVAGIKLEPEDVDDVDPFGC